MSDVAVSTVPPRSVAAVTALGDAADLRAALLARFGAALPDGPGAVEAGGITWSRLAPERVLAAGPRDGGLPAQLAALLDGIAAVTDQSDLWHTVAITGPDARDVLARIVAVDLDAASCGPGAVILTRGHGVDLRLWCLAPDRWELAVPVSFRAYVTHVLDGARHATL